MRFRAILIASGKTATGLRSRPRSSTKLGGGKRAKVAVTFNGHTYRSSVAVMGGRYLIPVSADVRAASGASAGDELDVDVVLDDAPREVEVPPDLAEALAAVPGAADAFAGLSYSHQRRHVLAVEGAKAVETRARRVAAVVAAVTG